MVGSEFPSLSPSREEKLVKVRRADHIAKLATDDDCTSCSSIFDHLGVEYCVFLFGKFGGSDEDCRGDEGSDFGGCVLGSSYLDDRAEGSEIFEHVRGHLILKRLFVEFDE